MFANMILKESLLLLCTVHVLKPLQMLLRWSGLSTILSFKNDGSFSKFSRKTGQWHIYRYM